MTDKYFIGIDPGIQGGIVCLDSYGNIRKKTIMPIVKIGTKNKVDPHALTQWLRGCCTEEEIRIVAIEEQRPMHKIGEIATFGMGRGYGIIEGVVAALELPYELIRPVDWQREMFKGFPKAKTKELSKQVAKQLYPKEDFKRTEKCKNVHDGLTDAVLISEYIRRKIK